MQPLHIVLACADRLVRRARYVFDTLFLARGIPVTYVSRPPSDGPWVLYGESPQAVLGADRCLRLSHSPEAWEFFDGHRDVDALASVDGLPVVLTSQPPAHLSGTPHLRFDILANAFYFLSSWSERGPRSRGDGRGVFKDSVYCKLAVPQDVVDRYLQRITEGLDLLCERLSAGTWPQRQWPERASYAILLSHDVDFIPGGYADIVRQGAKTLLRHLVRYRNPVDAARAGAGLLRALARGRDPYGCVPEIIAREKELGVRASFQVAVGHRHPFDVNYRVEDDRVRDYLRVIVDAGFELCLHGSYRSTENPSWYAEEVALLSERLARPLGSRQHFLSFDYDALFRAQERSGIRYDMSMGYPDRIGARAGFSYPYFPWCIDEDRPYNVLQVSLFLMDVTLRGYMGLGPTEAWRIIATELRALECKRGGVSVVWHPIVFGGARDPGYAELFWRLVEHVRQTGGIATDGRTIDEYWRRCAKDYHSFSDVIQ